MQITGTKIFTANAWLRTNNCSQFFIFEKSNDGKLISYNQTKVEKFETNKKNLKGNKFRAISMINFSQIQNQSLTLCKHTIGESGSQHELKPLWAFMGVFFAHTKNVFDCARLK